MVRWETHTSPGVGADAQDVINQQLTDEYDIFIGIMWSRFGTPTGRAGSGTAEEFDRAYQRYLEDPDSLNIMFYFKDSPMTLSKIDIPQLSQVNKFREELTNMGVFYRIFIERDEFRELLRLNLSQQMQRFVKKIGEVKLAGESQANDQQRPPIETTPKDKIPSDFVLEQNGFDDEIELGFLDLIEISTTEFSRLTTVVEGIGEEIEFLGKNISARTKALENAQHLDDNQKLKIVKKTCAEVAQDLKQFAQRTDVEVPIFSEGFKKAIGAYGAALTIANDFGDDADQNISLAVEIAATLHGNLMDARKQIADFGTSIRDLPRMTSALNRAKRSAVSTVDRFVSELDVAIRLTEEIAGSDD